MDQQHQFPRRDFLKLAGAVGIGASVSIFPFRNLRQAWAFGEHPQEKPSLHRQEESPPGLCAGL